MASESKVIIISRQMVKPSRATPAKLKMYKLSLFDQLEPDHIYIGSVMFYLSPEETHSSSSPSSMAVERGEVLKKSLSSTLSHFYPLAGEVSRDGLNIDCNNNGAYYVEAVVKEHLSDVLSRPYDEEAVVEFLPFHPRSAELVAQTYMVMIQVNTFMCGGIGIGVYTSHKVVDGKTVGLFRKVWAAQAAQGPQIIPDLYTAPTLFKQDPELSKINNYVSELVINDFDQKTGRRKKKVVMRRFVFSASSLASLKAKTEAPSRALAVAGLLWKCTASMSRNPSIFSSTVGLRTALAAYGLPVAPNSTGNLFCFSQARSIPDAPLNVVIRSLADSIAQVQGEQFAQLITGDGNENISHLVAESWSKLGGGDDHGGFDLYGCSIVCWSGIYQVDFGWGKPIWAAYGGSSLPTIDCRILLGDTRSGGGIEATVTLDETKMESLQKHPDLLQFATLDPPHLPRPHL